MGEDAPEAHSDWVTLNQAIAAGVRRARLARGLTQDDLAGRLRAAGFTGWTRPMVAALETKRRQISVGDLVALSVALGVPPGGMIDPAAGPVSLDDGTIIPASMARRVLSGRARGPGTLMVTGMAARRRLVPSPGGDDWAAAAARGDLERRIARLLGVPPTDVASAGLGLWGRSPTEERDRRAARGGGTRRGAARAVRREIEGAIRAPTRERPAERGG